MQSTAHSQTQNLIVASNELMRGSVCNHLSSWKCWCGKSSCLFLTVWSQVPQCAFQQVLVKASLA